MAKWTDLAKWRGPTSNQGGKMVEVRGVVLHIAQGSYAGTVAWQLNPTSDVSSHFVKGKVDGEEAQIVDTGITAWTQKAGNGHWLSIENAGSVPDKLTASQVEFAAQILAKAHVVYGVPLQVTDDPNGRGLGHHSMGADPGSPDDWGHSACPGKNIIAQKPAIVARAKEIVEGDVALTDADIDKVANKTVEKLLQKNMPIPEDWKAQFPDDPTIQDGEIGYDTAVRSGYFHSRQGNEQLDALEAKVDQILIALAGGPTLPPPGNNTSTTGKGTFTFELDAPPAP
jgi:hypothetical protein